MPLITENEQEGIINTFLNILEQVSPKHFITYPEANVFKNLAYDVRHNLTNNELPVPVFNAIEFKKEEDPYYVGGVDLEIQAYLDLDIYKYTGIDLETFLSLPIEYAEMIKDMVLVKIDKSNTIIENMDKDMNKIDNEIDEYTNMF